MRKKVKKKKKLKKNQEKKVSLVRAVEMGKVRWASLDNPKKCVSWVEKL